MHLKIGNEACIDVCLGGKEQAVVKNECKHIFLKGIDCQAQSLEDFMENPKGIFLIETENVIEIYNDPFCSIPIYIFTYYKNRNKEMLVTSEFEYIYKINYKWTIDIVGISEVLIYESPLWTRTIYTEGKQLPAATKISIDKKAMQYKIDSWFDFNIKLNAEISTENKAILGLDEILQEIFSTFQNREVVMGISGGLDSRLSAAMLSQYLPKESIELFTFGYNKKILEYKYAKKVADLLGLNTPCFMELDANAYKESYDLPIKTGAQIGINHCHIYYCLRHMDLKEKIYISNYYSDAVMGWDAKKKVRNDVVENTTYYHMLSESTLIASEDIKSEVIEDLKQIVTRYQEESNFSCMDEFIYVTERNPKFHVRMTYQQADFVNVQLPYANMRLLKYMISVPLEFRQEKKLEQMLIEKKIMKMFDISSRRYFERGKITEKEYTIVEKIYYTTGYVKMRSLNLANYILNKMHIKVRIFSPYLTENLVQIFNGFLVDDYVKASCHIQKIVKDLWNLNRLIPIEYRATNIRVKYTIIGLFLCIDSSEGGDEKEIVQRG